MSRDELRHVLWAADTFVDFEVGLNSAVRKLREALDDSADTPRFVETLPRRGYRFLGAVTRALDTPRRPSRLWYEPDAPTAGDPVRRAPPGRSRLRPGHLGVPSARRPRSPNLASAVRPRAARLFGAWPCGQLDWRSSTLSCCGLPTDAEDRWTCAQIRLRTRFGPWSCSPSRTSHGDAGQESFVGFRHGRSHVASRPGRRPQCDLTDVRQPVQADGQGTSRDWTGAGGRGGGGGRRCPLRRRGAHQREAHSGRDRPACVGAELPGRRGSNAGTPATESRWTLRLPRGGRRPRRCVPARNAVNPKAYDAYVKALTARGFQRYDGFRRAVAYFEEAVAIQPDFAEAYAALARAQVQFLFTGPLSPSEAVPKAEAAARKALELDPTSAHAHMALAQVLNLYYWRWDEGRRHCSARSTRRRRRASPLSASH